MGQKQITAVCVYGAQILLKHLKAMEGELGGVRQSEDIEYIHRMRVASRRMRTALELFKSCFPKKERKRMLDEIRTVTHALGSARDSDVQIVFLNSIYPQYKDPELEPGMRRLLLRLHQKREKAQKKVLKTIDKFIKKDLIENINSQLAPLVAARESYYVFTPALYQHAFQAIKTKLDDLLSFEPFIDDPSNEKALHAMRLSAKGLRYTLEVYDAIYEAHLVNFIQSMRLLQDSLGLIHDLDVWIEWIPKFIEDERKRIQDYFGNLRPLEPLLPGLEAFRNSCIARRDQAYYEFMVLWQNILSDNTWEELLKVINIPFDLNAAIQALESQPPTDEPPDTQNESL